MSPPSSDARSCVFGTLDIGHLASAVRTLKNDVGVQYLIGFVDSLNAVGMNKRTALLNQSCDATAIESM